MKVSEDITGRKLEAEFVFTASRSRGPGGQNVNKVNTRIELRFNVLNSRFLSDSEKMIILDKLRKRISIDGELIVVSQSERSQLGNKKKATERLYALLSRALEVKPSRIPTSPTAGSKTRRIESKRKRAAIKKIRSKPDDFEY